MSAGARRPVDVAGRPVDVATLEAQITSCRRCPRLVEWRERVAVEKRAAFAHESYWGRPITGFGDRAGRLVIIGLAPAAHGANRTGRIFTGDRSGDFLYAALHRAGYANQALAVHRDDGLALSDCFITCPVRCAPPANKPTPAERDACATWLHAELATLERPRVFLCLGGFAWESALRPARFLGHDVPRPKPRFGHGAEVELAGLTLLGCFHVSQQNTFTGRLTPAMMDGILARARELA